MAIEVPPEFDENLKKGKAGTININIYGGEIKSELAAGEPGRLFEGVS